MKISILIYITALLLAQISFANVKTVTPKEDEILEIKTALGIATIIQIPDPIQSAIIGDQSAYRIEYVDKAVTIKPLRYGAKTNLYLFTQKKRYNLRLEVVPQDRAFYIVYVKDPESGGNLNWKSVNKSAVGKTANLKILRVATSRDGFLLLDLELTAKGFLKAAASDFWLKQGNVSKPINSLFLSRSNIQKGEVAYVGISVQKSTLSNRNLSLEFENHSESLRIELTKEFVWN
ncbi:MAG: TrbG/VirB9 family P-type conjugative transfer protein [Pseudobdellovibrionaceae bacterium]